MVVGRKALRLRHQSNDVLAIPPSLFYDLVRGSVEVEPIDVGGFDDASVRCGPDFLSWRLHRLLCEPDSRSEMGCRLRLCLVGQRTITDEPAIGREPAGLLRLGMNSRFDPQGARFASIEFEGREEGDVFYRFDLPSWEQAQSRFREGFDAHHARKQRSAVNLMIVKEGLHVWVQGGLNRVAVVKAEGCHLPNHGPDGG